jgi:hypothetical protein
MMARNGIILTCPKQHSIGPSPYLPSQLSATTSVSLSRNKVTKSQKLNLEEHVIYLKLEKLIKISLLNILVLRLFKLKFVL